MIVILPFSERQQLGRKAVELLSEYPFYGINPTMDEMTETDYGEILNY